MAISDAGACKRIDGIYKHLSEPGQRSREIQALRDEQISDKMRQALDILADAEQRLIERKGLFAADLYEHVRSQISDLKHLLLREAQVRVGFAYSDISSGAVQKAYNCYILLGYPEQKAWMTVAAGLINVKGYGFAAQCYGNAGKPELAGRLFSKLGKFQQAGWYFEMAKQYKRAAVQYKKGQYFDKAGDCYSQVGDNYSAVKMWKKAGTLKSKNLGEQLIDKYSRKPKDSAGLEKNS
jgi:tetratricopeptide (TPR) repeat protein